MWAFVLSVDLFAVQDDMLGWTTWQPFNPEPHGECKLFSQIAVINSFPSTAVHSVRPYILGLEFRTQAFWLSEGSINNNNVEFGPWQKLPSLPNGADVDSFYVAPLTNHLPAASFGPAGATILVQQGPALLCCDIKLPKLVSQLPLTRIAAIKNLYKLLL